VAKTVGATVTHYVYDLGGNLIAEADGGSGAATAEYVALEGKPLAYIATGAIYWVHGDHLGTPQMLTDAAGAAVWDATYRPFGEATVTGALTFNLRFPGQYEDAETGLHYNYFRDYDASLGRYIQSDPIGLQGGWNTYGYVAGNPVMAVDQRGLLEGKVKGNWYSGCNDDDWEYCDNKCKAQGASGAQACAVQNWWAVAGVNKKGKPIPILRRRVDCECNYDDGSSVALLVGAGCLLAIICIIDPPACLLGLGAGALAASES